MNLGGFISDEILAKLKANNIEIGNVYLTPMDESSGITPKDGELFKPKFFIVLGIDDEGNLYGGTVINSTINKNLNQIKRDYHYPIKYENYDFLEHDSFVNCAELKILTIEQITKGKFVGCIEETELSLIKSAVVESPYNRTDMLKSFHLI